MIKKIFFILLFISLFFSASAQVVINELSPSNNSVYMDEDGEYSDWIELYNGGVSPVYIGGYGISDDANLPYKWIFPGGVSIPAHGFLTVFASDKDRKEFFNHWETVVNASDIWRYIKPLTEPDSNWRRLSAFNDGLWLQGAGGIGYGDGDDNTLIPAPATSVYLRRVFTIADTSVIASAVLHMDYDDAFVAYINGVEIARANIGVNGVPVGFSTTAFAEHEAHIYTGGSPETFVINENFLKSFLRNGNNVLAIQVHNVSASSSDMTCLPWFSAGIKNSSNVYGPVPAWFNLSASALHTNFKLSANGETVVLSGPAGANISQMAFGPVLSDHSYGCHPDGISPLVFFNMPTPNATNNNAVAYPGYASDPVFSIPGGFYSTATTLTLSSSTPGALIHFTLDGSIPENTSPVYSGPLIIDSTEVVRARTFHPTLLEGNTITNSYFISDSSSARLPVISLTVSPKLMFDAASGIYVKGPNAEASVPFFGANFWQEKEIPAHIEYYDSIRQPGFKQNIGIEIYGNYSRSYPQKSMKLIARDSYGKGSFDYQLFPDKDIHSFKQFIIRNSGTDWNQTHMRDALIHSMSLGATDCDMMAYQPAVVYINGKYWGVYNMREKINKDYLAENHNTNRDSVDLLEYNGFVMEGSNQAFIQMGIFVLAHDMSVPANFAVADSLIDLKNFADYFAVETWTENWDWLTNNVRYWRENKEGEKWRYILWDLDNGMGGPWSYVMNSLDTNLHKPTDYTSILFSRLLVNPDYRNYFINRYADLLNTLFTPQNFNNTLNYFSGRIDHEMIRHFKRWGAGFSNPEWGVDGHGSYDNWKNYQVPELTAFCNFRQITARNHIQETFGLKKQVPLTLNVYPPGAGKIIINTVTIDEMPWPGVYFDSVPVTITAIPNPGYEFSFWQSTVNFPAALYDSSLTFIPDTSEVFTAFFMGQPDTAGVIFSEINYNSSNNMNAGDWVELHNYGQWPVDISEWKFKDSQNNNIFVLPENTVLHGHDYLVLCQDTVKFKTFYPGIVNFLGPFDFGLNSATESIRLFDKEMKIYISVTFSGSAPWPAEANGTGRTLELLDANADINNPLNWFAGCPGGSPGGSFAPCDNSEVEQMTTDGDNTVAVYPNPAMERLVVNINPARLADETFAITLYDITGKTIFNDTGITSDEFYVQNHFEPGIYLYKITSTGGYLKNGKVVFQK